MALTATVFKAELQISDMDRNYYADHHLTIARHPSETDERMMVRLAAFAFNASDELEFTKGLCADDEPEIWQKSLTDEIDLWIEVGLPEEKRIRKACNRSKQVIIYTYGGRNAELWWERTHNKVTRFDNLWIVNLPKSGTDALTRLVERSMRLQCSIQDGVLWISSEADSASIEPETWYGTAD